MFFWAVIDHRYVPATVASQRTSDEVCVCIFMVGREWRASRDISFGSLAAPMRSQDRTGAVGRDRAGSGVTGERAGDPIDRGGSCSTMAPATDIPAVIAAAPSGS